MLWSDLEKWASTNDCESRNDLPSRNGHCLDVYVPSIAIDYAVSPNRVPSIVYALSPPSFHREHFSLEVSNLRMMDPDEVNNCNTIGPPSITRISAAFTTQSFEDYLSNDSRTIRSHTRQHAIVWDDLSKYPH